MGLGKVAPVDRSTLASGATEQRSANCKVTLTNLSQIRAPTPLAPDLTPAPTRLPRSFFPASLQHYLRSGIQFISPVADHLFPFHILSFPTVDLSLYILKRAYLNY